MTDIIHPEFTDLDLDSFRNLKGALVLAIDPKGTLDLAGRRINRLSKGIVVKFVESQAFEDMAEGGCHTISPVVGMEAERVIIVKLSRRAKSAEARKAGANAVKKAGKSEIHLIAISHARLLDLAFGMSLRMYAFDAHKTNVDRPSHSLHVTSKEAAAARDGYIRMSALAEGVFFTRDLVNEPANFLTTTEFADRLVALESSGLKVTVLEEDEMEKLGMHALLGVGLGSASPSKMVVMEWNGGGDEQPFALVGKGVVFDTGGISLKPAAGMEDMTMDMGGAGVVAGVMKTLALRKAKANVVGLVGLVENMPDGLAQRPGDVVTSMKGDTIEVINTDAEGRLVLADVLWYAQKTFNPTGVINLATLTGAIIVGLGHENAGVFSNDDTLCNAFLKAAASENEGAWRMPLSTNYDKLIKSNFADMKNTGGRSAGSITAGQFLQRFVAEDMPWIHLDIAGVASVKSETNLAPRGATGWGVMALNRLIEDTYEPTDV